MANNVVSEKHKATTPSSPILTPPEKKFSFSHEQRIPSRIRNLLEADKSYSPAETFDIFEPGLTEWTCKSVTNLESEINGWSKHGRQTKILIVKGHLQSESTFPVTPTQPTSCYPIAIPKEVFKPLLNRAGIPLIYAAILFQHNARYLTFSNGKRAGFIIHMRNPGFSYAVTYPEVAENYDPKDSVCAIEEDEDDTTYGIVLGLREKDIKIMKEEIIDSCASGWLPAVIATCLLEMMGVWTNSDSSKIYGKLRSCETELQTKANSLGELPNRPKHWFRNVNLDPLTRDLTIISTSLARITHQTEFANKMLAVVTAVNKDTHYCSANDTVTTRLTDLQSYFEVLQSEAKFYMSRAEANRATVFNLIQQQDNLTNVNISHTNLMESNAMKVLAKATARDSSQMLFFSIITFILLPATFTGTFFSTTFFSFQDGEWEYSSSLWIYFATTIPLGLVIGFSWWLYQRLYGRDWEKRLQEIEINEKMSEAALS